jgi:transcriptional regulator with XRE-family HTH domain
VAEVWEWQGFIVASARASLGGRRLRLVDRARSPAGLGVSGYTVTRWEAGTMLPTARNARKLARRLGVDVEALELDKPT